MAARSQLLLEVFTTNVNTIFENFHHSDPAPPSSLHDTSGETRLFLHKNTILIFACLFQIEQK